MTVLVIFLWWLSGFILGMFGNYVDWENGCTIRTGDIYAVGFGAIFGPFLLIIVIAYNVRHGYWKLPEWFRIFRTLSPTYCISRGKNVGSEMDSTETYR